MMPSRFSVVILLLLVSFTARKGPGQPNEDWPQDLTKAVLLWNDGKNMSPISEYVVKADGIEQGTLLLARHVLRERVPSIYLLKTAPIPVTNNSFVGVSSIAVSHHEWDQKNKNLRIQFTASVIPIKVTKSPPSPLPTEAEMDEVFTFFSIFADSKWDAEFRLRNAPEGNSNTSFWELTKLRIGTMNKDILAWEAENNNDHLFDADGWWLGPTSAPPAKCFNSLVEYTRVLREKRNRAGILTHTEKVQAGEAGGGDAFAYAIELALYNRLDLFLSKHLNYDLSTVQWVLGQSNKNSRLNTILLNPSLESASSIPLVGYGFAKEAVYAELVVRDSSARPKPERQANYDTISIKSVNKLAKGLRTGMRFYFVNVDPIVEEGSVQGIAWRTEVPNGLSELVWCEPVFPFELETE